MAESNPLRLSHEQLRATLAAQPLPFIELFERQGVSLELTSPRTADTQQPHDRDELYCVASGHGTFRREDEVVAFETGDFLFVAAHVPHRFETFSDDFQTWVVFFGPVILRLAK
jgi:mannose-6-phosphate isomerase-like protein (cupin superfamily)